MLEPSVDSNSVRQSPACTSAVPDCTGALAFLLVPLTQLSAHRGPYPRLRPPLSLSFFIVFFLPRSVLSAAGFYFVFYFSARPAPLDSCDSVLVVCPYRPLSVALFVLLSE